MATFIDNTQEIVTNELLRNYEQNRKGWLNSQNLSPKKKKELDLGLDMVYNELKQGTLSRNELREFVSTGSPELSWARQTALGYLSQLLDVRPQTKPKELDKYSNTDLKRQFANAGWASNNEINLNNWEALDYDESNQQFTGTTKRFKQMADFLSTYKDNIEKQQYNFEGSRYTGMEDLTTRLNNAITILNTDKDQEGNPISSEVKMDAVRQSLSAIGWNDSDINNLFRMSIPVETEEEEREEERDPLLIQQEEYNRMLLQHNINTANIELQEQIAKLQALQGANIPYEEFGTKWRTEIQTPYLQVPIMTTLEPTNDPLDVPTQNKWTQPIWADYTPETSLNQKNTNLTPDQLSQLGTDLRKKLQNVRATDALDNQSIKDLKLIYEKSKGTVLEDSLKSVSENSSEVYLDHFVFWDKGIYYSYDPTTKKLYRRRIMDNKTIFNEKQEAYVKQYNSKNGKDAAFYDIPTNKLGGILKYENGDQMTFNFTPKPATPANPKSDTPTTSKVATFNGDGWESGNAFDLSTWTWQDYNTLGQVILDLGAIPASFAGPYGPLIGGGMGLISTIGGAINDFSDGVHWGDFVNLGVNLGADTVGLIPAWGELATTGKVLKTITTSFALSQLVGSVPQGAAILDKYKRGEEITMQDVQFLSSFFSGLAGMAGNLARKNKTKTLNQRNGLDVDASAPREHDVWFNDKNGFFTNWMRQLYQGNGPLTKSRKDNNIYYNRKTGKWINAEGIEVDPPKKAKTKPTTEPEPKRTTDQPSQSDTKPQNTTVKKSTIDDIPKNEVKAMRDAGYSDAQILKEYNRKKGVKPTYNTKGGTLEQLKSLRIGGVLKCENGRRFYRRWNKNPYESFIEQMSLAGYTYNSADGTFTDTSGVKVDLKNSNGEVMDRIDESNYDQSEYYSKMVNAVNQLNTESQGTTNYRDLTQGLEAFRAFGTAMFNNSQEELAKEAIYDNMVLPQTQQFYGAQLSNGMADVMGYDQAISNVINTVSSQPSTDISKDRQFQLAGLSQINDLTVKISNSNLLSLFLFCNYSVSLMYYFNFCLATVFVVLSISC